MDLTACNLVKHLPLSHLLFYFFQHHVGFPALLVGGFYPQRASGQAVVTGVHPSPPPVRTCLYFLARMGFSIPTARRFSSNVVTIEEWRILLKKTNSAERSTATNEANDGPRPPSGAAGSGRLFLPAPPKRLALLGCLAWLAQARSPPQVATTGMQRSHF